MDTISALFDLDFSTLFLQLFLCVIGIRELFNAFHWLLAKLGIEFKWMKAQQESHNLLNLTTQRLTRLEEQHHADMEHSNYNDDAIRKDLMQVTTAVANLDQKLDKMEAKNDASEMAKLKETLLTYYRLYREETQWSELDADMFWDLFASYEAHGGNGYLHTVVEPAMRELEVIDTFPK